MSYGRDLLRKNTPADSKADSGFVPCFKPFFPGGSGQCRDEGPTTFFQTLLETALLILKDIVGSFLDLSTFFLRAARSGDTDFHSYSSSDSKSTSSATGASSGRARTAFIIS